ncbi:21719_t:CDS:2, partial [Dentiscutata erythropus]
MNNINEDNEGITTYKKTCGILYGIGYNINNIIGAGIFNPESIWILVHSPGIAIVLYVVCGIISLLGSSVYIELGIRSLHSGIGEQKYITDAFYPKKNFGHVFSFVAIFVTFPGAIVAEFYGSTQFLLYAFRDTLIMIKFGLVKLGTNHINWIDIFNKPSNSGVYELGAYGSVIIKILFLYEGWDNINYLIGEFNPRPDSLKYPSLILKYPSLIICLTNAAYITVVGYNVANHESIPIAIRFGKELFDGAGEKLMSILVAISGFGCVSAM